jgi:hypothetical protein
MVPISTPWISAPSVFPLGITLTPEHLEVVADPTGVVELMAVDSL